MSALNTIRLMWADSMRLERIEMGESEEQQRTPDMPVPEDLDQMITEVYGEDVDSQ